MTLTRPPAGGAPPADALREDFLARSAVNEELYAVIKARLESDNHFLHEDAANAFNEAVRHIEAPETRRFITSYLRAIVESFLNSSGLTIGNSLGFFEDVLKGATFIVGHDVALGDVSHIDVLAMMLDESRPLYIEKKGRVFGLLRAVVRSAEEQGTFQDLFELIKRELVKGEDVPSPRPTPPPSSESLVESPTAASLARPATPTKLSAQSLITMLQIFHRAQSPLRGKVVQSIAELLEIMDLRKQRPEDVYELNAQLGHYSEQRPQTTASLDLWLRCLECDAFPMKKLGLEMIGRICLDAQRADKWADYNNNSSISNHNNPATSSSTSSSLAATLSTWSPQQWLLEKNVLQHLFNRTAQTHEALVTRSKPILDTMARGLVLKKSAVAQIFASYEGRHETDRGAVHTLLAELILDLRTPLEVARDTLEVARELAEKPESRDNILHFAHKLNQLDSNISQGYPASPAVADVIVDLYWALIVHFAADPLKRNEVLGYIIDALRQAMTRETTASKTILRAVKALKTRDGATGSDAVRTMGLLVLTSLVSLYPLPHEGYNDWRSAQLRTQVSVCVDLQREHQIISLVVDELCSRLEGEEDLAADDQGSLKVRLDFLRLVLLRSNVPLHGDQVDRLWNALAKNHLVVLLQWIRNIVDDRKAFEPETCRILLDKVCALPGQVLCEPDGFSCFASLFFPVNGLHGNMDVLLNQAESAVLHTVHHEKDGVVGREPLWSITLDAETSVAQQASMLLLSIAKTEPGEAFVQRLFQTFEKSSDSRRMRCVALLGAFLCPSETLAHSPPRGSNVAIECHHDQVLVFSASDIGKVIERRVREPLRSGLSTWMMGVIVGYDATNDMHQVWFVNGQAKVLELREVLTGENNLVRIAQAVVLRPDLGVTIPEHVNEAMRTLAPVRMEVRDNVSIRRLAELVARKLESNLDAADLFEIQLAVQFDAFNQPCTTRRVGLEPRYHVENSDATRLASVLKAAAAAAAGGSDLGPFHLSYIDNSRYRGQRRDTSEEDNRLAVMVAASPWLTMLFDALADPQGSAATKREIFTLLMRLPSDVSLLESVKDFTLDWKQYLGPQASPMRAIYALQIAERLMDSDADADNDQVNSPKDWVQRFLACRLDEAIVDLLLRFLALEESAWERAFALPVLIRMTALCIAHLGFPKQGSALMIESLTRLVTSKSGQTSVEVASKALWIIENWPIDEDVEPLLAQSSTLVNALVDSPDLRRQILSLVLKLAKADSTHRIAKCSLEVMRRLPPYSTSCAEFFELVDALLQFQRDDSTTQQAQFEQELVNEVFARLCSYEYSGESEDPTLAGLLHLAQKLHNENAELDVRLADALLRRYLLFIPTLDDPGKSPVASSEVTVRRCYTVLFELVRRRGQGLLASVVDELEAFCLASTIPQKAGPGKFDWSFKPEEHSAAARVHRVGLINQGATCYQNSVLQQFFMRPAVRECIFKATGSPQMAATPAPALAAGGNLVGPGNEDDNEPRKKQARSKLALLRNVQKTFAFMQGSTLRYFNPRALVNCTAQLKLPDGHLNQNDAVEFYSQLLDYFEECFKGRPEHEELNRLIWLEVATRNVRHCPKRHDSERRESKSYLTLQIRTGAMGTQMNSLKDAFAENFKSNEVSDLDCDQCSAALPLGTKGPRFEATQVKYITRLPSLLVIQLMRFDYDYEAMVPVKLNHRVAFEHSLDLSEYTSERVLSKLKGEEPVDPPGGAAFRLVGVVVHQGSGANFGHYYSFIKDAETGEWFKFDDERVTPFPESSLDDECFGGPVAADPIKTNKYSAARHHDKNNNAYILFYERVVDKASLLAPSMPIAAASSLPKGGGGGGSGAADAKHRVSLRGLGCILCAIVKLRQRVAITHMLRAEAQERERQTRLEVSKENEKALRHSVLFAPDFLHFCLRLASRDNACIDIPAVARRLAIFEFEILTRVVLFSMSEKHRLVQWVNAICALFARCGGNNAETRVLCDSVVLRASSEVWVDTYVFSCPDVVANHAVVEVLCSALDEASREACLGLMQVLNTATLAFSASVRLADGLFILWHRLAKRRDVHSAILELDLVAHLAKFLEAEVAHLPYVMPERTRGGEPTLASRLVSALDSLLADKALSSDEIFAFPLLPEASTKRVLSQGFLDAVLGHAPRSGIRLLGLLCVCDPHRLEYCVEHLVKHLSPTNAGYVNDSSVEDAASALRYLLARAEDQKFLEGWVIQLIKIAKEAKRVAAEKKSSAPSAVGYSMTVYHENERREFMGAALRVLHAVAETIAYLYERVDLMRVTLSLPAVKWSWLVTAVEETSFEDALGSCPHGLVRHPRVARCLAVLYRAAAEVIISPRVCAPPCRIVTVSLDNAGSKEVNGLYRFDGYFPKTDLLDSDVPKFARVDGPSGRRLTMFRCVIQNNCAAWYVSEVSDKPGTPSDKDFYVIHQKDQATMRPAGRFSQVGEGERPPPMRPQVLEEVLDPADNVLEFYEGPM